MSPAREPWWGLNAAYRPLIAGAGLPQVRAGTYVEPGTVTMGDGLPGVAALLAGNDDYTAADVISTLLSEACSS